MSNPPLELIAMKDEPMFPGLPPWADSLGNHPVLRRHPPPSIMFYCYNFNPCLPDKGLHLFVLN